MSENEDKHKGKKAHSRKSIPSGQETPKTRHAHSRREALKRLAVGGAVLGGAVTALPKKWMKPVVDSVIVPVHAQATGIINAFWIIGDDAPGGPDVGIGAGTTSAADTAPNGDYLYDDGTNMRVYGTVVPPAAVTVSVSGIVSGTTYASDEFGSDDTTASGDSGAFSFGDYSPTNGDFGDTPGDGTITLTVSAPGYASSVITLNINFPAAP